MIFSRRRAHELLVLVRTQYEAPFDAGNSWKEHHPLEVIPWGSLVRAYPPCPFQPRSVSFIGVCARLGEIISLLVHIEIAALAVENHAQRPCLGWMANRIENFYQYLRAHSHGLRALPSVTALLLTGSRFVGRQSRIAVQIWLWRRPAKNLRLSHMPSHQIKAYAEEGTFAALEASKSLEAEWHGDSFGRGFAKLPPLKCNL